MKGRPRHVRRPAVGLAPSRLDDALDLCAVLSHELRTPLTTILGSARAIMAGSTDPDVVERAEAAFAAGRRLQGFADNVAIWLERDAGGFVVERRTFKPKVLIEAAVAEARRAAQAKALELRCNLDPSLTADRLGDRGRLRIILDNLLDNAVKFTAQGSIEVSASIEKDRLIVDVDDTGVGLDPNRVRRLFAPFVQLDDGVRRRFEGAGLGLAVALFLAEAMNGSLSEHGAPGLGANFRLDIDAPTPLETAMNMDVLPELKIQVVEDNHANRRIIELVLRELGHHVDSVEGGRQALESLTGRAYDLIILDLHMPEMDGFETARAIRARYDAASRTPILALSADTRPNIKTLCAQPGMDAYLSKPLDVTSLAMSVAGFAGARTFSRAV